MKKAKVLTSESAPSKFRLVLDVNDSFSVGTIMNKGELRALMNDIRMVLEGAPDEEPEEGEE